MLTFLEIHHEQLRHEQLGKHMHTVALLVGIEYAFNHE